MAGIPARGDSAEISNFMIMKLWALAAITEGAMNWVKQSQSLSELQAVRSFDTENLAASLKWRLPRWSEHRIAAQAIAP